MEKSKQFSKLNAIACFMVLLPLFIFKNGFFCANAAAIEVRIKNSNPAIAYAGSELGKYTELMTGGPGKGVIEIGLFDDFKIRQIPILADRTLDDAIIVQVKNGTGFICGSNPRSVLQGVYRFLWELGCRWFRPGSSGEIIPALESDKMTVSVIETASYRNRIICIEGAVSLSNALDIIEWMPKVGFNGFMMQFRDGYTFFDRWYSHEDNPQLKRNEPLERTVAQEYTRLIEKEIIRRGLIYHAVGHGWNTESFGVPALGWMMRYNLPQDFLNHIALVNGQRSVLWNIPTLTALCYSDPYVQQKMVNCIADYAQTHSNVDYLHVWLEDGSNGKCECEVCHQKRPSDFYIQILNKLDEELKSRNLNTRIVFIAYSDLLWSPVQESLKDIKRFTFLYANSRSDYTRPLDIADTNTPLIRFRLNQIPSDINENKNVVAFLNDWENKFSGDRILFEYYGGAETVKAAKNVWQDVRNLNQMGLNGIINCQSLRVFFPNGLGMVVLGKTLWNRKLDFEDIAADYFMNSYGSDGKASYDFMRESQNTFESLSGKLVKDTTGVRSLIEKLKSEKKQFQPIADRNSGKGCESMKTSWDMMEKYLTVLNYYIQYAEAKISDEGQGSSLIRHRFQQYVFSLEKEYQPYLQSGDYFNRYMK